MMSKNAGERIKIPQIKTHPWFVHHKISFEERKSEGSNLSQSNLMTDSMLLDGEDPFDDFMNKRVLGSSNNSTGNGSVGHDKLSDISAIGDADIDENVDVDSMQRKLAQPTVVSFRKQAKLGDFDGKLGELEVIPEEMGVELLHPEKPGNRA